MIKRAMQIPPAFFMQAHGEFVRCCCIAVKTTMFGKAMMRSLMWTSRPLHMIKPERSMRSLLPVLASFIVLSTDPALGEEKALLTRVDDDGVQRVRIVGGEYFFEPQRVVVKANIPVEISLSKDASIVPHSFVIDAPQAGIVVDQELSTEIRKIAFTPTAPGIYPYYCRNRLLFLKSHRDRGMEGTLEVVP
jgi:hypothetical protein